MGIQNSCFVYLLQHSAEIMHDDLPVHGVAGAYACIFAGLVNDNLTCLTLQLILPITKATVHYPSYFMSYNPSLYPFYENCGNVHSNYSARLGGGVSTSLHLNHSFFAIAQSFSEVFFDTVLS